MGRWAQASCPFREGAGPEPVSGTVQLCSLSHRKGKPVTRVPGVRPTVSGRKAVGAGQLRLFSVFYPASPSFSFRLSPVPGVGLCTLPRTGQEVGVIGTQLSHVEPWKLLELHLGRWLVWKFTIGCFISRRDMGLGLPGGPGFPSASKDVDGGRGEVGEVGRVRACCRDRPHIWTLALTHCCACFDTRRGARLARRGWF